jgi:hypothetical protein
MTMANQQQHQCLFIFSSIATVVVWVQLLVGGWRFDIGRVCVIADRGMITAETVAELEARRLLYILGVRERSDKLVRALFSP